METYEKFKKDLLWFCIVFLALQWAYSWLPIFRDSTDGKNRSGMELRTDAMTGCQYLEGSRGGLTPRLDGDGRHVCER